MSTGSNAAKEGAGDSTANSGRYVHQSPLRGGNTTFHGHTILATSNDPGFRQCVRIRTKWDKIMYIINVEGSLEDGFQHRTNSHLLDDLPKLPLEGSKYAWLARFDGENSKFTPRVTGTPDVCDPVDFKPGDAKDVIPEFNYMTLRKVVTPVVDDWVQGREDCWTERVSTVTCPGVQGKMVMRIVEFPESLFDHPLTRLKKDELYKSASTPLVATAPRDFEPPPASVKMVMEIDAYRKAASIGIVPKFIGLVVEEGRGIIGYLSEFIEDCMPLSEIAKTWNDDTAIEDIRDALKLVMRLHNIDVIHGDLHPSNVIKRDDGTMLLIDFGDAHEGWLDFGDFETVAAKEQNAFHNMLTQLKGMLTMVQMIKDFDDGKINPEDVLRDLDASVDSDSESESNKSSGSRSGKTSVKEEEQAKTTDDK
ncbi:hypothetical protein AB5N19_11741 [Seiridium cardinale]